MGIGWLVPLTLSCTWGRQLPDKLLKMPDVSAFGELLVSTFSNPLARESHWVHTLACSAVCWRPGPGRHTRHCGLPSHNVRSFSHIVEKQVVAAAVLPLSLLTFAVGAWIQLVAFVLLQAAQVTSPGCPRTADLVARVLPWGRRETALAHVSVFVQRGAVVVVSA